MGFILNVIDEDGNDIPFNRIRVIDNSSLITKNGYEKITIQILDKKSEILSDEDIDLIMELLLNAIDDGGSYEKMKKMLELFEKLLEENTLNE